MRINLSLLLFVSVLHSDSSVAAILTATNTQQLQHHLLTHKPTDTLMIKAGIYSGHFSITAPIHIKGELGSVIDANGKGVALTVAASNVTIEGLTINNWGDDLYELDAAILITEDNSHINILHNTLSGTGFGIRADDSDHLTIKNNMITGNKGIHILDRGDGIHLNHVRHARVLSNEISAVRDGVYIESGDHSLVSNNRFSNLQYAIHYMYSQHDEAFANVANNVYGGYAIMSSKFVYLHDNKVNNAQEFGVLLNITNGARVESNHISHIHNPLSQPTLGDEGKGLYVYGARDNNIKDNVFSECDIGISMAMGGEKNRVYGNDFIDNFVQVKYVGDELLQWSHQGQGNYWSSYVGWDTNGDGAGESHYQPNDALDKLFWLYPEAKFLLNSPVIALLRWIDSQLAIVAPTGIIDDYPAMNPLSKHKSN
ncbi:nitrous oxide reductase family maturation protein NosD [Shewanella intestini]|uniref:Nitrous oxide reductase family maturation protein NosD n=2 Tax=Shewanellaceae TaxID=267890 RepID=A0ABS5I437_9GAMM|nr:nitrous oxide reductase family maturation protein NosD [Shewanella intestini]MRG36862.1 nitrous oxide reductase family maturation protein NosD [Shewanella sp. XMDDZSB0408]